MCGFNDSFGVVLYMEFITIQSRLTDEAGLSLKKNSSYDLLFMSQVENASVRDEE